MLACEQGIKPPSPEEEMPEVEIDIDDLLDAANEEERALKLQVMLFYNFKSEGPEVMHLD
uniref:Uncharacterized protein n=1 Tax=Ficedula albicollis TaxID=59894 RepID=A0A803W5Z0_FICAL